MYRHTITALLAISATLIALSIYVFERPILNTLDIIFNTIASCALGLGVLTIITIAIIAVFYPKKLRIGGDIYSVFRPKDFVGLSPEQIMAFFDGLLKLRRLEIDATKENTTNKEQAGKAKEESNKGGKA